MATYTHPLTGEVREYIPYAELKAKQKKRVDGARADTRYHAAEDHLGLDKLVDDSDWRIREAVAGQGYALEELVNDPAWCVRREVAWQGYGLDKLVNDPDDIVRKEALLALKRFVSVDDRWTLGCKTTPTNAPFLRTRGKE